jgi:hypothetical protein
VVEVDGVRHTARHVVVATGSDPVVPPVPGLSDLRGVWTSRGVTGMTAIPRRLIVLGGEVALVEGGGHVLVREPAPLGEALGEVLRRDGEDYVLVLDNGRELRGDRLLLATGRRPRVDGLGLETVGVEADGHGIPVDAHLRAGERLWAIGDVTGVRLLTHMSKYQGEVVAANILGEPREANYEAVPDVVYTDPQAASVGASEARFSATSPVSEVAKTGHLHARLRRVQRLPDAPQRRRAADRRLRARPGSRRMAATGHAGHPRPRAAAGATRHHPAVPHLLRSTSPPSKHSTARSPPPASRSTGKPRPDASSGRERRIT